MIKSQSLKFLSYFSPCPLSRRNPPDDVVDGRLEEFGHRDSRTGLARRVKTRQEGGRLLADDVFHGVTETNGLFLLNQFVVVVRIPLSHSEVSQVLDHEFLLLVQQQFVNNPCHYPKTYRMFGKFPVSLFSSLLSSSIA